MPRCEICGSDDRVQRKEIKPLRQLHVRGHIMVALPVKPWLCFEHRKNASHTRPPKLPKHHNQEPLF